jgi:hypothetical protein
VGNCYYGVLNLVRKLFNCSMYCQPAVMTIWHLNVPAWENVKLWRNSFGTEYVVSVCSCMNIFIGSCLHESAVNMYWKCFNCGLSGTKEFSVPDVVCADLHTIRKHIQRDQSSNRCMPSDQQGSESSPTGITSSGTILLTSPLSGMNWYSVL